MQSNDPNATPGSVKRPIRFMLWSWLTLLVVLLSAAPSGEQTRTRPVGSAFDPTTASVAVNPKQPKAKALSYAAKRPLPGPTLDTLPSLVASPNEFVRGRLANGNRAQPIAPVALVLHSRPLTRAHGPRAPPTA